MKKSLILMSALAVSALSAAETATDAAAAAPVVVQETEFSYEGKSAKVDDEAASDKKAGCMLASQGWTIKYFIPATLTGKKEVIVTLRTDAKEAQGSFIVGLFDRTKKEAAVGKQIKVQDYAGTAYKDLSLGEVELSTNLYLFLTSLNPKNAEEVHYYVDKVTFK